MAAIVKPDRVAGCGSGPWPRLFELNRVAGMARYHILFPRHLVNACLVLSIFMTFSSPILAQQNAVNSSTAEVTSLCNPDKIESSGLGGKTTYTCEGKRPTARPGGASKYKAVRSARAEISCNYAANDGEKEWLGCSCTADEDSKCTGFIMWCATQGEEVSGNSNSASCSPKG